MSKRFTRINMAEYDSPEAMRPSMQQYEDELAPKIMEYAEDIRITINGLSSALRYIIYPNEQSSLIALELRKKFTARQTEARLLRDVIYFYGYLEFATSKSFYSNIQRKIIRCAP